MIWRSIVLLALVTVATATSIREDPPSSCQGCREIVSYVRQFNSSAHRQEYKDLFKNFCEQYYPVSTDFQQGPCPTFVEGFFYILDQIDPVHHCDQIGACGRSDLPSDDIYDYMRASQEVGPLRVDQLAKNEGRDDPITCKFCVSIMNQLKYTAGNPETIKIIKEKADFFCDFLVIVGQDKECHRIIDNNLLLLMKFFQFLDVRAYCQSISACPKDIGRSLERTLPTLADFNNFGIETSVSIGSKPASISNQKFKGECVLCKTMVKEMFNFLRENRTEANIVRGLDKVCHLIYPSGGTGLRQCQDMIQAYTRELVELLVDETDPDMICMILGLCANESNSSLARKLTTNQVAPRKEVVGSKTQLANMKTLISALEPTIGVDSPKSCVECKMFIEYLKNTFANPKSQEEVRDWLLANLCNQLPGNNLVNTCTSMVQTYAPVIFEALKEDLNPQVACVKLGVCEARASSQVFSLNSFRSGQQSKTQAKSLVCDTCVDVVTQVDDYMSKHSPGQDISTMKKVCDNFSNSLLRRECISLIERYGLEIITLVPSMESPRKLCAQIELC